MATPYDRRFALRAAWDAAISELSTLGRLSYAANATDFSLFLWRHQCEIIEGTINPATVSPITAMRKYLLRNSDIDKRRELLDHIVASSIPTGTPRPPSLALLAGYQLWAKTAVWEDSHPNLNKRMKQFIRQCGWMYFPILDSSIPTPTETQDAESESVVEPIADPIEPIADPIVTTEL